MLDAQPTSIIDIGSNSVRLVVYAGAERMPAPIFNEKVMAGLGTCLAETGRMPEERMSRALAALARFRLLLNHMEVKRTRVVATAAVRDAENGKEFVRAVERLGFRCKVLSAEDEARLAGEGVLSAIPAADGIVGDLGGGSLELVDVSGGRTRGGISLPLGVLRVRSSSSGHREALRLLEKGLRSGGLDKRERGRPFYMVGGSWRALARIDMIATGYPLPIIHQYDMAPERAAQLKKLVAQESKWSKEIAPARLATSPVAAMLLAGLVEKLQPSKLVVSTSGIREGLLYTSLSPDKRRQDPLIEEVRNTGAAQRPFGAHGDLLDEWIGDIFDDTPELARIRLAACLLADVVWQANPAFRADRGVEMALHGNWVGVNAAERVMMAQALSSSFDHDVLADLGVAQLCSSAQLRRAHHWGLAMRLGQKLCGGVGSALDATELRTAGRELRLSVHRRESALVSQAIKRRLRTLAEALGLNPVITSGR